MTAAFEGKRDELMSLMDYAYEEVRVRQHGLEGSLLYNVRLKRITPNSVNEFVSAVMEHRNVCVRCCSHGAFVFA